MNDVFCKIIAGEIPSFPCYQDDEIIVIMDASPFNPGHILIIPKNHYTTILDMDNNIISRVHEISQKMIKKMEQVYPNIESVKVIVNYGKEQQVKHYHMHLIPFYKNNEKPNMSQEEFCELLKK